MTMRKYGTYNCDHHHFNINSYDIADCQDQLPKGVRIRNKKQKRRLHNKSTRQIANAELRNEINEGL